MERPEAGRAETRKLAAIMFTDMVGFSRQMGADEARMLRLLDVHNQVIQQAVAAHHGAVIKRVGDAFLVDFPSVVHAVQCAQQIQAQLHTHNTEKEKAEQIHVRIGIHSGDIIQRDGDVFGDGVNIASRLQALAEPDTVCISDVVYRDVAKKVALGTGVSLGRPKLKNIAERFHVYALLPEAPKGLRQTLRIQRLKLSRRVRPAHQVVVAGLVLVATTIIAVRYLSRPPLSPQSSSLVTQEAPALPLPDKPSIVVLPFTNMSNASEQDYFSDDITEDITSDLSRIASLFVIARNSAFTYKGKAVKVQDVSREIGVRYVLEGSVRKADNQVRVTAQLIDATTGEHLWSERYDRPLKDIFALQDEIVQKIVTTLKLQLMLREQGYLIRKTTSNLAAYDYYLQGIESFYRFTKAANAQARQMFEKAIELDPRYAEAYARLSWTYYTEWLWRWSVDPQTLEQALALAQNALALDDSLPVAHSLLSLVYEQKQQYDQALAEGERAIALDPNSADSYGFQGYVLTVAGRPEEALRMVEQAMRLNPHYPPLYLNQLGWAYRLTGRYAEAVATLDALSYAALAETLSLMGRPEEAIRMVEQALRLKSSVADGHLSNVGTAYYLAGRPEEAIAPLKQYLIRYPNILGAHLTLAAVYSELGREAEARAEAAEVLRINPQFSLEVHKQREPIKDPAMLEGHLAALRKAGLK